MAPSTVVYITALLLFVAIIPLPYGYYTLLRIVATGVFAWAAVVSHGRDRQWLTWLYGLLAILFNPLLPIHLPKEVWIPIDVTAGLLLLLTKRTIAESRELVDPYGNESSEIPRRGGSRPQANSGACCPRCGEVAQSCARYCSHCGAPMAANIATGRAIAKQQDQLHGNSSGQQNSEYEVAVSVDQGRIHFHCPNCGETAIVEDTHVVMCPRCRRAVFTR